MENNIILAEHWDLTANNVSTISIALEPGASDQLNAGTCLTSEPFPTYTYTLRNDLCYVFFLFWCS